MASTKEFNHIKAAYKHCYNIVAQQYENFPIASWLLPRKFRDAIVAIYAFARTADDYVDSAQLSVTEKINKINFLEAGVVSFNQQNLVLPQDFSLIALHDTIKQHQLPQTLVLDLLTAFKQDITINRYPSFAAVLEYCKFSANPIGRLLLHLNKAATEQNLLMSDHICTGLQLINFMQDLYNDLYFLDRCYIPEDELNLYQVSIDALKNKHQTSNITELINLQLDRTYTIYVKGIELGTRITGRFGAEIRMIIAGGLQILMALRKRHKYYYRPVLTTSQKIHLLTAAFMPKLFFKNFKLGKFS